MTTKTKQKTRKGGNRFISIPLNAKIINMLRTGQNNTNNNILKSLSIKKTLFQLLEVLKFLVK